MKRYQILVVLGLIASACGHKQVLVDQSTAAKTEKNVITVVVGALKEKRNKFDMQLALTNESAKAEIIWIKDVQCSGSGRDGTVSVQGFSRDASTAITLKPEETKTYFFVCDLNVPPVGPYRVTIARVFENPSGDGMMGTKIIGKNVVIEQAAKLHAD